jgi:hypothetical protein
MAHPVANAIFMAYSTTFRLSTGSMPGMPRHTGHTCVLAGAPNAVEQPQVQPQTQVVQNTAPVAPAAPANTTVVAPTAPAAAPGGNIAAVI